MITNKHNWIILIVDDEESIHENLKFTLRRMVHANKEIVLLHAYSAKEAKKIIAENPTIAVIVLDVMMERDDAGLSFVQFLRDEANNKDTRVLLYTGQPTIAPKREVAEKYIIDGYLDKNSTDNNDCYVAVRLALKSYEERLKLKASSKKEDINLLEEIAAAYVWLLEEPEYPKEYEEVIEKVNSMLYLSQEILASYALEDLKSGSKLGTTKTERLSRQEYAALVNIHHIKVILNHTSIPAYEREKNILFHMITREAQKFATIRILPDTAKQSLEACLENCNALAI